MTHDAGRDDWGSWPPHESPRDAASDGDLTAPAGDSTDSIADWLSTPAEPFDGGRGEDPHGGAGSLDYAATARLRSSAGLDDPYEYDAHLRYRAEAARSAPPEYGSAGSRPSLASSVPASAPRSAPVSAPVPLPVSLPVREPRQVATESWDRPHSPMSGETTSGYSLAASPGYELERSAPAGTGGPTTGSWMGHETPSVHLRELESAHSSNTGTYRLSTRPDPWSTGGFPAYPDAPVADAPARESSAPEGLVADTGRWPSEEAAWSTDAGHWSRDATDPEGWSPATADAQSWSPATADAHGWSPATADAQGWSPAVSNTVGAGALPGGSVTEPEYGRPYSGQPYPGWLHADTRVPSPPRPHPGYGSEPSQPGWNPTTRSVEDEAPSTASPSLDESIGLGGAAPEGPWRAYESATSTQRRLEGDPSWSPTNLGATAYVSVATPATGDRTTFSGAPTSTEAFGASNADDQHRTSGSLDTSPLLTALDPVDAFDAVAWVEGGDTPAPGDGSGPTADDPARTSGTTDATGSRGTAVETKATARKPPARPVGSERGRGSRVAVALVLAVVLLAGAGAGVTALLGSERSRTPQATPSPTGAPASPYTGEGAPKTPNRAPLRGTDKLSARASDPRPLTVAELSAPTYSARGGEYARTGEDVSGSCAAAADPGIAPLLASLGCSQAVSITVVNTAKDCVVTFGALNLPDQAAAGKLVEGMRDGRSGSFVPRRHGKPSEGVAGAPESTWWFLMQPHGHWVTFATAAYASGRKIAPRDPTIIGCDTDMLREVQRRLDTRR